MLLSLVYAYIYISQGSVETHLPHGGIHDNCIIANCLQSAPVKNFENLSIISEDMDKSNVACFFLAHGVVATLSEMTWA